MGNSVIQGPSGNQKDLWIPADDEDRKAIREQLGRIIASPMFKNSLRCTTLLSYVVQRTLNGNVNHVKERTIGIEAFGRDASYDTNEDPVVRNTAVNLRRRLAQYYEILNHEDKIRIDLPTGGYTPEYRKLAKDIDIKDSLFKGSLHVPRKKWLAIALVVAGITITIAGLTFWQTSGNSSNALAEFWSPVVSSSNRVLICMPGFSRADTSGETQAATGSSLSDSTEYALCVRMGAYSDSVALSKIAGIMTILKKGYRVQFHTEVKLEDFKSGPVIIIGGPNNQWTSRKLNDLRFHFQHDDQRRWICDRENPNNRNWSNTRGKTPENEIVRYGLISRVSDPKTGENILIISGLSSIATSAAAEFVSERGYMEKVAAGAPRSWDRKNLQIVISVRSDGSNYSPPAVEAVHFW
jgi:hypothetical protein